MVRDFHVVVKLGHRVCQAESFTRTTRTLTFKGGPGRSLLCLFYRRIFSFVFTSLSVVLCNSFLLRGVCSCSCRHFFVCMRPSISCRFILSLFSSGDQSYFKPDPVSPSEKKKGRKRRGFKNFHEQRRLLFSSNMLAKKQTLLFRFYSNVYFLFIL